MPTEDLEQVGCNEVFLGQPTMRVKHEIVELLRVAVVYVLELAATKLLALFVGTVRWETEERTTWTS